MNTRWKHRSLVAALSLLILLAAALLPPSGATAAVGSSYSYIIDGEELAVGYDPLSVKSGLLLPEELFRTLEIDVRSGGSSVQLTRGSLQVSVKVGDRAAVANGAKITLAAAPIRANGQLYLPEGVLAHLGVEIITEGSLLLINRWPLVEPTADDPAAFAAIRQAHTLKSYIQISRADALTITLTYLKPEIIQYKSWTNDPSLRGRTQKLLESGAVLLDVEVFNELQGFYQFNPNSLYIVDDLGNQYAFTGELIPVQSDIAAQLAPTAKARAIMIFPALRPGAKSFKVYATTNQYAIGAFTAQ